MIETKNIKEVQDYFTKLQKKINNTKPILKSIGEKIVTKSLDSFDEEADPITGRKWSPIAAASLFAQTGGKKKSRIKSKKRHTKAFLRKLKDKKILQNQGIRGGLMGSIDYNARKEELVIVANKEYAATHQYGDKKRNIKQRRYLPFKNNNDLGDNITKEILEDLSDFILGEDML